MGLTLTKELIARLPSAMQARLKGGKKRSKYGNRRTVVDGISFDSAKEAAQYTQLKWLANQGECWFIRQPIFDLPRSTYMLLLRSPGRCPRM